MGGNRICGPCSRGQHAACDGPNEFWGDCLCVHRFRDMEARVVALEAVIQKVRDWTKDANTFEEFFDVVSEAIGSAPSVVLADHDAAVWDEALDHVWQLNDPAYTVVGPGLGDKPVVTEADIRQARAENPYRGDNR